MGLLEVVGPNAAVTHDALVGVDGAGRASRAGAGARRTGPGLARRARRVGGAGRREREPAAGHLVAVGDDEPGRDGHHLVAGARAARSRSAGAPVGREVRPDINQTRPEGNQGTLLLQNATETLDTTVRNEENERRTIRKIRITVHQTINLIKGPVDSI